MEQVLQQQPGILNLLGPMANPGRVRHQLIGVANPAAAVGRGGCYHAGMSLPHRSRSARPFRSATGPLLPARAQPLVAALVAAGLLAMAVRFVASGGLQAESDGQLWSLVFTIAENSLIEKARVFRVLQEKEGEDGEIAWEIKVRGDKVWASTYIGNQIGRASCRERV